MLKRISVLQCFFCMLVCVQLFYVKKSFAIAEPGYGASPLLFATGDSAIFNLSGPNSILDAAAALAWQKSFSASVSSAFLVDHSSRTAFLISVPFPSDKKGNSNVVNNRKMGATVGFGYIYSDFGRLEGRTEYGALSGKSYSPGLHMLSLAVGSRLNKIALGVTGSFQMLSLSGITRADKTAGLSIAASFFYHSGVLNSGFVLYNLPNVSTYEVVIDENERKIKQRIPLSLKPAIDISSKSKILNVSMLLDFPLDDYLVRQSWSLAGGVTLSPGSKFKIATGFHTRRGYSLGIGYNHSIKNSKVDIELSQLFPGIHHPLTSLALKFTY